ncbi:MAG: S-adenosyl-l-methionine hydroxide adenosyltransferase family protein [Pirellulaceae bacterium]
MPAIITLTTDFGQGSPYVAQMKGVILSLNPRATIVDITHAVAPQDVQGATYVLDDTYRWFPDDSIHVTVVDPGVGTERDIIYARIGTHHFIAPNNGLLTRVSRRTAPEPLLQIAHPNYWLPRVSSTFHGRDIMAPAAAHLSLGLEATKLGPPLDGLVTLDLPQARLEAGEIHGVVMTVDSFGNLITNIERGHLAAASLNGNTEIRCGNHCVCCIVGTYGEGVSGEPLALIGSSGRLEIAVANGHAATQLRINVGTEVIVGHHEARRD